jgi:hypothetical protein
MIRSLLCAGLLAATANAQTADTGRVKKGDHLVSRVILSTLSGTVAAYPLVASVMYATERTPVLVASGAYVSIVALTASAIADSQPRCKFAERFQHAFVGGLMGFAVGATILNGVRGTHVKGLSGAIPVSAILLATPVGASLRVSRCD